MAWWPSSRGLTGFASAVLRALFDGFDGMVASERRRRVINAEGGEATDRGVERSRSLIRVPISEGKPGEGSGSGRAGVTETSV